MAKAADPTLAPGTNTNKTRALRAVAKRHGQGYKKLQIWIDPEKETQIRAYVAKQNKDLDKRNI